MKALPCSIGSGRREAVPAAVLRTSRATSWTPGTPLRFHWIASLATLGVIALLLLATSIPVVRAEAHEGDAGLPPVFDTAACYLLVQETGRMIAWVRWEVGAPKEKVVAHFDANTPDWIVELTNRWIEDAYHWEVTDDQVRQWAGELGDASASSLAEGLTTPETIAIWLRRIARQCREQHA